MKDLDNKRYKLNEKQLHILKLTYKFRFITAPLLAKYKSLKSRHAVYESLEVLKGRKYLAKRINKNEKFQNKGARYYLTTESVKLLKGKYQLNENVLHAVYNNKSISEGFVDHTVDIMRVFLGLQETYGTQFDMFTATELLAFDSFPEPRPDLFINRFKPSEDAANLYMLDILRDSPSFVMKKRIAAYIEHYESGEWDEDEYPAIALVCPDARVEKLLQDHICKVLESTGIDDEVTFLTTSKRALDNQILEIWTNPLVPNKLLRL